MLKIPQIQIKAPLDIQYNLGKSKYGYFKPNLNEINFSFENKDYTVTLNEKECPVRGCRVSAIPFNRIWPGKQRDMSQTEEAAFITFSADEAVTVRIKAHRNFQRAVVRPLSKQINPEIINGEIVFQLSKAGSYVLELDGFHHALHIFYNPIKEYPEAEQATYFFGPGLHFPGTIHLRDNDTIYIDEEAIVFGSLYSTGAENIKIYGGGILDNSCEERILEHGYENYTKGNCRLYQCNNVTIEDVIMTNSSTWILSMFYCNHVTIDNIKLVGHWRYNTDGIDIVNTSNVLIKNSFIRSFDDTITIKGIYEYNQPIENITVDNCVLWCGWGNTCEIGVETWAPEYNNICFQNSDVIHSSAPALAILNTNDAEVHHITFQNINVEFQKDTMVEMIQETDESEYDKYDIPSTPVLIALKNYRRSKYYTTEEGTYEYVLPEEYGWIHDVFFNNIRVFAEEGITTPKIIMKSDDEHQAFENITISNLFLNGEKQTDFHAFDTELVNSQITLN